jgi:hypothetical protein
MAAKGDSEAQIYLDHFKGLVGCIDAMKTSSIMPDDAMQALHRSSDRGCPLSQLNLTLYLMRTNEQDDKALSLLELSTKAGLLEAHMEIGSFAISNRKGDITAALISTKWPFDFQ